MRQSLSPTTIVLFAHAGGRMLSGTRERRPRSGGDRRAPAPTRRAAHELRDALAGRPAEESSSRRGALG
jgi:hypothetical protein